jgi:hypothetical protein
MQTWSPFDAPYDLHTDRELEFMLTRGKPLAHFYDAYPPEPDEEVIPRSAFAPYVADGTFEKCEFVELLEAQLPHIPQVRGTIHVFYARKSELWRIDAHIRMKVGGQGRVERASRAPAGHATGLLGLRERRTYRTSVEFASRGKLSLD